MSTVISMWVQVMNQDSNNNQDNTITNNIMHINILENDMTSAMLGRDKAGAKIRNGHLIYVSGISVISKLAIDVGDITSERVRFHIGSELDRELDRDSSNSSYYDDIDKNINTTTNNNTKVYSSNI